MASNNTSRLDEKTQKSFQRGERVREAVLFHLFLLCLYRHPQPHCTREEKCILCAYPLSSQQHVFPQSTQLGHTARVGLSAVCNNALCVCPCHIVGPPPPVTRTKGLQSSPRPSTDTSPIFLPRIRTHNHEAPFSLLQLSAPPPTHTHHHQPLYIQSCPLNSLSLKAADSYKLLYTHTHTRTQTVNKLASGAAAAGTGTHMPNSGPPMAISCKI